MSTEETTQESALSGPAGKLDGGLAKSVSDLLEEWRTTALKASDRHSAACDHFESVDGMIGLWSTVLTAIVGSTIFLTLQHSTSTWSRVVVGVLGIVAAIMSGIQTTAKYGQRAERHRQASRQYGVAVRQIAELRALPPGDTSVQAHIESVRKIMDDTGALAPNVPPRIWSYEPSLLERLTRSRPAEPAAGADSD